MGTQKNRLNETVLLSTQNICENGWLRKYLEFYAQKFCSSKPVILYISFRDPVEDSSTESDELQEDNDDIDSKSNDQQSNQDCNDSEKVTICNDTNESSESTEVSHTGSGDNVEVETTQKSDSDKQSVCDDKVNTELVPNFNDLTVTPGSKTGASLDKDDDKFNESSLNADVTPEVDDKSKSGDQNVVTNAKDNVVAENDASSGCDTQGTDDAEKSEEETMQACEIDTDLIKEKATVWSKSRLNEEWRRFNLDLSPKVFPWAIMPLYNRENAGFAIINTYRTTHMGLNTLSAESLKWRLPLELGLITRKPVFGISDKVRFKPFFTSLLSYRD